MLILINKYTTNQSARKPSDLQRGSSKQRQNYSGVNIRSDNLNGLDSTKNKKRKVDDLGHESTISTSEEKNTVGVPEGKDWTKWATERT